jgi:flotillin
MSEDLVASAIALAFTLLVVTGVAVITIKTLIVIVPPNVVAVLTGRKQELLSGETVDYRTVIGGRTLRVPLIESVQYMSLASFSMDTLVPNAMTQSNTPLTLYVTANLKIASEPPSVLRNAVERLLGRTEEEIMALAKNALQGAVREFVAALKSEEVAKDPSGFSAALTGEARTALATQGFHLDLLEIKTASEEPNH